MNRRKLLVALLLGALGCVAWQMLSGPRKPVCHPKSPQDIRCAASEP